MAGEQGSVERSAGQSEEKPKYTLEDYEREKNWDGGGFGPNNPGAWGRVLHEHSLKLREIETYLKQTGVLAYSEQEKLEMELDRLYPGAKSKSVVEHNGQKYRIRYFPLDKSNSGKTVYAWGHRWELVKAKE